jgi:tetratricopeptide (TPR) repeat protein
MFDALTGAMTRVLTLLGSAQEGAMHARAYFELAMAAYWQGENQRAQGYLGQSLGIWEHLGNQIGIISSLNGLGLAATDRDDYRRAEQFFGRTRDLSTRIGYQLGIAVARMNLTMVSGFRGEFGGIAAELDDVLALAERIGATGLAVGPLRILGYVAEHEARYTDAEAIYEQGLELQERLGIQAGVGYSIKGLANVALARGDLAQAEVLYRRALAVLEPTHLTIFIADCWIGLGKTLRQCGDLLTAAWLFRRARRTGRRIGCVRVEAMATVDAAALQLCAVDANLQMNPGGWAEPLDASGQKESASGCGRMAGMRRLRYARALLARGQRLANSCDALVPLLEALLMAAELHLRDGDLAAARAAADEAQQRATRAGMRRCEGQALYARGRCALAAGCSDEAEAAVRAALSLQEAIGAALDAERSRACLEELRASLE